jgi:prepilin-type N-terminal cleavage/methylation domain-containing protein
VSSRRGFTLIELLVAMVVLAILVTIGITNLSTAADKSADAAAVSDLRNAMSAEEAYRVDHESYADPSTLPLTLSTGVSLGGTATAGGFALTARHQRSASVYAVVVGSGGTNDGLIEKQAAN